MAISLKSIRKHLNTIILGIVATWSTTLLINPQIELLRNPIERLEGIIYDLRLNATLPDIPPTSENNIFIVDIDEKSLEEIGRWPWSRLIVKEMVEQLMAADVYVIGFDVIFSEPEINPVDRVLTAGGLKNTEEERVVELWNQLDADGQFGEVLAEYDIVIGALFQPEASVQVGELMTSFSDEEGVDYRRSIVPEFAGKVSNVDALQSMTNGQGFINSSPDADGYIRRANLVIQHEGKLYPSLALEVARLAAFEENINLILKPHGDVYLGVEGIKFGSGNSIATDEFGRVLVPFKGGQKSFPYYSASDIIAGRIPQEKLEAGFALVGTSAVGLADLRATSVGLQYPGVEVHANVLEGLLREGLRTGTGADEKVDTLFSSRPWWWIAINYAQVILLGLILAVTLPFLGPMAMALMGTVCLVGVVAFNIYMWMIKIELPIVAPLAVVLFITFYNISRGFFTESANKQRVKSMFDQYVPPAHIDKMIEDPDSFTFEGERKELSVLFSDIRSFTTISEKLSANELKDMLNEYFTPITKSIFEHQGTIDKYIGDLVMAIWGAPVDVENHAEAAVIGGFDMLAITARLREEFVAKDWPAIRVGIGVNTGEMNVGDMGSVYRRSYTVLGDAVNLGSRLEGLTKFYGVEFLVSEFTKEKCPNIAFRPADKVKVKGKDVAVAIFEPVCKNEDLTPELTTEIEDLNQAYNAYLSQTWDDAEAKYRALSKQYPDRYLYQLYLERIEHLRQEPPGENWDGSFTHTSK